MLQEEDDSSLLGGVIRSHFDRVQSVVVSDICASHSAGTRVPIVPSAVIIDIVGAGIVSDILTTVEGRRHVFEVGGGE